MIFSVQSQQADIQRVLEFNKMKRLKFCALLTCLIALSSCSQSPDFYFLDGKPARLSEYRGQWLLVNFWAEWCSPCREEVPELNELFAAAAEHNLAVIGISYDPLSNDDIRSIVKDWNIKYPVVATEPMPILPFKLPKSLPGNYIISPEGEVVSKLKGKQSVETISKLLINLKNKNISI